MLAADPSRASQDNDELEIFASWALNQGVKVYNVKPVRFPGRGLGIAATRKIKVCSDLQLCFDVADSSSGRRSSP